MKDEKVTFEMVFPIEPYRNFKLGIEGSVEPGETYEEAAQKAYDKVMDQGNLFLANLNGQYNVGPDNRVHPIPTPVAEIRQENINPEDTIAAIESCKDLKVLESYKLIAKLYPDYQEAYDTMYQKLSQ